MKTQLVYGVLASVLMLSRPAFPQSSLPALTFEVASVKEAASGSNGVRGGCHGTNSVYSPGQQVTAPPLGRCVITDARLSHLIGIAYSVTMQDLTTGPEWIQRGDLRFNVEAKAEDPSRTTEPQLLTMLQNLLVERFELKFHYETADAPGFAITVDKNLPRLQASKSEDASISFASPDGEVLFRPLPGQPVSMRTRRYSVAMLVNILSLMGQGHGVDRTGLTGEYDFVLSWDDNAGPTLSTALREQLGLRMERASLPVSTFVVDSARKPLPN